jgi:cation diffusion facilitator CzcD-associated flavoprotein CzcO
MSEPDPSQRTNGSVIRTDVGIIGAGPAGLATAVHLGQLGVNRVILEGSHRPGGSLSARPVE